MIMDVQAMISQVVQWHRECQYRPIVRLLEILIESNGSMEELSRTKDSPMASLYIYFGDSLYQLKYFRRALRAYEQAISFNDMGLRRASTRNSSSSCIDENELKYRIHLCHLEMHEPEEARKVLEKITSTERTVKILSSLADLYSQERNNERAREQYLHILKRDPLRLDIVIKVFKLNPPETFNSGLNTVINIIPDDIKRAYSWYTTWITAQYHLHSPNSKNAIRAFEQLTSRFERRATLLANLAQAYYYDGNFKEAVRIFQIAYNIDPHSLSGVSSYAACLHKEASKQTLEQLAVSMSSKCLGVEGEVFHEPWLALAHYYASIDKDDPKALLFAQKAYKLKRDSIEALILLACLNLEKEDSSKAIPYIKTAQTLAPYRYEVQRILCDAYLSNNQKVAALNYAKAATKSLGESARSFYLWADVMLKSHDQRRKNSARNCLEKAIKLDPTYLPAIFAYVDLLMEDKDVDKALELLNNALPQHSTNTELHGYLYRCYTEKVDTDRALYHQNQQASCQFE